MDILRRLRIESRLRKLKSRVRIGTEWVKPGDRKPVRPVLLQWNKRE